MTTSDGIAGDVVVPTAATHKFVVVLNKSLPPGVALNAAAHMAAGLVARVSDATRNLMGFIDYVDADMEVHPSLSALSLIVLRGSAGDVAKVRRESIARDLPFTDFTGTMVEDGYAEQLVRTRATSGAAMPYYGVCVFGRKDELEFTRKFSLWR